MLRVSLIGAVRDNFWPKFEVLIRFSQINSNLASRSTPAWDPMEEPYFAAGGGSHRDVEPSAWRLFFKRDAEVSPTLPTQ